MNIKKNSGVTLMETLVSVMLLIALVTGAIYFYVEKNKKTNAEIFGSEIVKYIKMTDEKTAISGFREDNWPVKDANDLESFKNFMYSNYNSIGSECADGKWSPVTDRSNTTAEEFKERNSSEKTAIEKRNNTNFLDCSYFSSNKFYFDMEPSASVKFNDVTKKIDEVNFVFRFKNNNHTNKDFVNIKRAIDMMKSQDSANLYGQHIYSFVSSDNTDRELKPLECLNLGEKCAVKASFKRAGQGDYVRTDGLSPIEDALVTFKMHDYVAGQDGRNNVAHGIVKNCDKWTFNQSSNSWTKTNTTKCGIGIYENSIVASLIDGDITSQGFYMNQQCNSFELNSSSAPTGAMAGVPQSFIDSYGQVLTKNSKVLPCGQFEEDGDYYVLSNDIHADEVNIGGASSDAADGASSLAGNDIDSKLVVAPSEEMINEDYQAKLNYDANPTQLTEEEKLLNPSKGDFRKPSTSSVRTMKDPSLSSTENAILTVRTKNMTIYEDLIVNKDTALVPEEVFITGELEVLNNYSINQVQAIDSNPFMTPEQKEEAKRKLQYSSIGGSAEVAGNLDAEKAVIGDDKLFEYDEAKEQYNFKSNPENIKKLEDKLNGTPAQVAENIKQISAAKDIKVENLSNAKNSLNADTLQFRANLEVFSGALCDTNGRVAVNGVYELFICQNGKWENFINEGGIAAFESATCPVGWRDFTEADGKALIGTGYFDTIHAGVVKYKTGDTGGEAMHQLTIDEMPSHTHNRPKIEHICSACHHNLGLTKIESGSSVWTQNVQTAKEGGDKPHNNMSPYKAVKFCISGNDELFDYNDPNNTVPQDNWFEYPPEESDFIDFGPKYGCFFNKQTDNSDPANPKTYDVEVCNQDQRKTIRGREINSRTSEVRYTGMVSYEYRTVVVQEAWAAFDPFFTACNNVGPLYNCGNWDKNESDFESGTVFTKSRQCLQKRVRYKQIRQRNWITGAVRVIGTEEEECPPPATVTETVNSTGTRPNTPTINRFSIRNGYILYNCTGERQATLDFTVSNATSVILYPPSSTGQSQTSSGGVNVTGRNTYFMGGRYQWGVPGNSNSRATFTLRACNGSACTDSTATGGFVDDSSCST